MKLRQNKESKTKSIIIFLILSIILIGATGFLAHRMINKMQELNETKNELNLVQLEKMNLEREVDNLKIKEEDLKNKAEELERKLEEFKKDNPEMTINPETTINLEENSKKYAYLTFDDGPSKNTIKILDFLKANGIKATFFVVGDPSQEATYRRIFDEGHTLAVHSYTHKFHEIYKSVDIFMADIHKLSDLIQEITGVKPTIFRFAGGSNNSMSKRYNGKDIMPEIISQIEQEGFIYYDWNVDSTDAQTGTQDVQIIIDSVLEGAKDKNHAIILMHDTSVKGTTVEALPQIVEGLKKQGFLFKEITPEVQPIQFRSKN